MPELPRFVIIAAPHTSNWDLPMMLLFGLAFELRVSFLMKAAWFRGPLGPFFRAIGGIPVHRDRRGALVAEAAARLRASERMVLAVPPEGSRSWRAHWRSGFYWIAHEAGVPIVPSFLDYGRRRAGIGAPMTASGDIHADVRALAAFYEGTRGKRPELQGPVRVADDVA